MISNVIGRDGISLGLIDLEFSVFYSILSLGSIDNLRDLDKFYRMEMRVMKFSV